MIIYLPVHFKYNDIINKKNIKFAERTKRWIVVTENVADDGVV